VAVTDGYATLPEVKAELRLTTTVDDARIERAIEAASRQIDHLTRRSFVATSSGVARVFRSWGARVFLDDAQAITLVEESNDQTTWTTVAATAYAANARPPIRSLARLDGGEWMSFVRATGTWGVTAIPPEVHTACMILAIRLFKRPDTPNGVLTGDFGAARLLRQDPDVLALVKPLARKVVG
jgi:hypothetical protein